MIRVLQELGLSHEALKQGLEHAIGASDIIVDGDRVMLQRLRNAEQRVANRLQTLHRETVPLELPDALWGAQTPHPFQAEAISALCSWSVLVVTGNPGCGKTALTKWALKVFEHNRLRTQQVAPTGKAAMRLAELTGAPASTIHRALGWNGGEFTHNRDNPLPCDALIIDESSMISVELMASLLSAVKNTTRLLIVGDVDQLPSIDAGRVLHDIIQSNAVPVARLTHIFRQASESRIPYIAREINQGLLPTFGQDTAAIECATEDETLSTILGSVTQAFPEQLRIHPRDVQVLCAQKNGLVGTENLNRVLQAVLNPKDLPSIEGGAQFVLKAGDRVIHTKNNYKLGVFNGETGYVTAAHPRGVDSTNCVTSAEPGARVLIVDFADRNVVYTRTEAKELQLAYALTVHKSQGSQFPAVILVAHNSHRWMLTRSLIYTAVTRAEKFVLVVGNATTIAAGAQNTRGTERRTQLREMLTFPRT